MSQNLNEALLKKKHEVFLYELKPETATSYYLKEGNKGILPDRIGFSKNGFAMIERKGRALLENKVGQIVGTFKRDEDSVYKLNSPFRIFSSIWEAENYPLFVGYGDIGVTNKKGKIETSKDLFIIYSSGKEWIEIHLFRGLIEFKDSVLNYLSEHKKQKP